ncbi:hypothetical protein SKAU_G00039480 [Synaphobranchus kaupii]|uniref:Uncharacterized protein n=1 Tax=Synaphobranchus kaupii TaxID=118154 RepID=A0A9Q1GH69_SYNKA|nr:hypothetical protein SKAU_G00039480 [Synaphobranchus kaupii]
MFHLLLEDYAILEQEMVPTACWRNSGTGSGGRGGGVYASAPHLCLSRTPEDHPHREREGSAEAHCNHGFGVDESRQLAVCQRIGEASALRSDSVVSFNGVTGRAQQFRGSGELLEMAIRTLSPW